MNIRQTADQKTSLLANGLFLMTQERNQQIHKLVLYEIVGKSFVLKNIAQNSEGRNDNAR
jgi:hypothetical protein